jgi:LysM repeat protein
MREYYIQPGDTFYRLAQRMGGTCDDWIQANPGCNPNSLQVGQKIVLPGFKNPKGHEQYAEVSLEQGSEYAGDHLDDIEMEIEGVRFRVKRIGESRIPHEIQLTVPRTEIRKIQPQGEHGPCEVQIMLSNVNIIHSPRLMSEGGAATRVGSQGSSSKTTIQGSSNQTGNQVNLNQAGAQGDYESQALSQVGELRHDIRPNSPQLTR